MHTTDQLNTSLAGRYAIDRLVGEGGMATVYLARDLKHNRKVALKVLKPDLGAVVGSERFLSEIQVTANLQHPNLLPLFDSGAADGLLFYVMPYVDGESLRARIQREKQLPVDEAVRLATAIASALDYAHRHGVIHRDLKPENILLHEGQPLVADFGIALAVSNAGGNRITQTGLSLGTPQYMSPEQATGDRVIDGRTDIYSLGALTYEMLAGEPPHTGSTSQAVIARVLTERHRPVRIARPNVPPHVEAAVDQALEKLPADRFATAKELGEALLGTRVVTRVTAAHDAQFRTARRANLHALIAWSVAVTTLAAVAFVTMKQDSTERGGTPAQFEIVLPDSMAIGSSGGGAAVVQLSDDASTLVVAARRRGEPPALWVRRMNDLTFQKVRGTDSARSPVLSPDGSEVLFVASGEAGALRRISLRGGLARTVATDIAPNGQYSWADDGRIIFARGLGIWRVPVDGGVPTLLAAPDTTRRHLRYGFPHALPGGRAALITIWRGGQQIDSAIVGVVTIPEGRVTELPLRGVYPRYSGTGHIVFGTLDAWLHAVPFDTRALTPTGEPMILVEGVRMGSGGAATYSVSRNGTLVYVGGDANTGELPLLLVDRSGQQRELVPAKRFYQYPRVSPDGRQVAVTITTSPSATPTNPDIWRVDTSSRAMMRVTTDSQATRAVWLTNESLGYVRFLDSVLVERQLNAPGGPRVVMRAPKTVADFAPGAPHGYAAFRVTTITAIGDERDIWLVHRDSLDTPRPFLTASYDENSPAISPDGKLIAYVTRKTGRTEVYVQRLPGGGEVQVSIDGGIEPVWSREGSELFYRDPTFLMSARIQNGVTVEVTRRDTLFRDRGIMARSPVAANYDVFPGGQLFAMLGNRSPASGTLPLVVRMNWHVRGDRQPER